MVVPAQRIGITGRLYLVVSLSRGTSLRDPCGFVRGFAPKFVGPELCTFMAADVKELARYKLSARSAVSSREHLAVGL